MKPLVMGLWALFFGIVSIVLLYLDFPIFSAAALVIAAIYDVGTHIMGKMEKMEHDE